MTAPLPFRLHLPEARLAALRARLDAVTWPDQPPGAEWDAGTSLAFMQDLVECWRTGFDRRERERSFNEFAQFTAEVDGVPLHFVHQPGIGPAPTPLMLLHGWPSSVLDFRALIPLQTGPARHGDDLRTPSPSPPPPLPGYTLSFRPGQARLDLDAMAGVLARLMDVLGYGRFSVQGGDWGAVLASILGQALPDRVVGLQLSMLPCRLSAPSATPEEERFAAAQKAWMREDAA